MSIVELLFAWRVPRGRATFVVALDRGALALSEPRPSAAIAPRPITVEARSILVRQHPGSRSRRHRLGYTLGPMNRFDEPVTA